MKEDEKDSNYMENKKDEKEDTKKEEVSGQDDWWTDKLVSDLLKPWDAEVT